jgi:protein-tyrosine phosphatase
VENVDIKGDELMAIVEFFPGLYGGGKLDDKGWRFIREHVNVVINIREKRDKPPFDFANGILLHKPLQNDEPPKRSWVVEMMDTMNRLLATGHVLYVHDTAGRNRLGFVLAAFCMQRCGCTRDEALREMRKKKSNLKPNHKYMRLLNEYETYLRNLGRYA